MDLINWVEFEGWEPRTGEYRHSTTSCPHFKENARRLAPVMRTRSSRCDVPMLVRSLDTLEESWLLVDLINWDELMGWEHTMCCMVRAERRRLSAGKIKNRTMQTGESRVKLPEFDSRPSIVYDCRPRIENWRPSGKTKRCVRKLAFLFGFALAGDDTKEIVGRT